MLLRLTTLTLFLALVQVAALGSAQTPNEPAASRLTSRGRQMVGGGVGGFYSNDRQGGTFSNEQRWAVYVQPSWTYFVRDHVGLGLSVAGATGQTASSLWSARDRHASIGIHGLFDVVLGPRVSLFLQPLVAYVHQQRTLTAKPFMFPGGDPEAPSRPGSSAGFVFPRTQTQHVVRIALTAPLVYHVSDAVGIGAGPDFSFDLFLTDENAYGSARTYRGVVGVSTALFFSF